MAKLLPSSSNVTPAERPPQHADETDKEERSLKQPDAKVGGKFSEMMGIRVNPLVRIHADWTVAGEHKGAPRREPLPEEVTRQQVCNDTERRSFSRIRQWISILG
jgi:hypothetical protein